MKFFKCVSINFKYVLSKQAIVFILISFLILTASFIFNTNVFATQSSKILYEIEYYKSYVSNSYNVLIVILGFFSVFLSICFSNSYDLYLITRRPRHEIILAKIMCGIFVLFIYTYISFCVFVIIPNIFMRYYSFKASFIKDFVLIFLNGVFLLLISMLFIEIFKNILSCFIVLVIYWAMKIFTISGIKKSSFIYFLNCFFPTLIVEEDKTRVLFPNMWIVYPLIIILTSALTLYYSKKSVK